MVNAIKGFLLVVVSAIEGFLLGVAVGVGTVASEPSVDVVGYPHHLHYSLVQVVQRLLL